MNNGETLRNLPKITMSKTAVDTISGKATFAPGAERSAASQLPSLLVRPALLGSGAKYGGRGAKLASFRANRFAAAAWPHRLDLCRANHCVDSCRRRDRRPR